MRPMMTRRQCHQSDTSRSKQRLGGTVAAGSPTVQAWQPCPLWEPSPSHPILL